MLPKIIVIVGATSSGKTALGLSLAKEFNGEVVSADSRQVYTKMTIGTAKPDGVWKAVRGEQVFIVDGIPHYMMDCVDPGHEMSLAEYKERAVTHINDIVSRGKVPIVVGGTGLYVWSIVDNLSMPSVPPNKTLRRSLEEKPLEELLLLLKKVDPKSFEQVDRQNPRRVIRALEVAILTGESFAEQRSLAKPLFEALQIGLKRELPDLYARIDKAIDAQIENGLVKETQKLLKQKYGWNLPSMSSIGYKQIGAYLSETMTLEAAVESIKQDTHRYAKRQITWFKRDKRIQWVNPDEVKNVREMVKKFLL
jgi:tRNA dimethylallyltransferase